MDLVLIRSVAFALDWVVQLAVLVLPRRDRVGALNCRLGDTG